MRFLFLTKKESEAATNVSRNIPNKDMKAIEEISALAKLSAKWGISYVEVIKKLKGIGLAMFLILGAFDHNKDDVRVVRARTRTRTQIVRLKRT